MISSETMEKVSQEIWAEERKKRDMALAAYNRKRSQKELEVFTRAKHLCEYAFRVSCKIPKEYRWNISDRMLNLCLDVVESLHCANDTFDKVEREQLQRKVDTKLKIFSYVVILAEKNQMFSGKQIKHINTLVHATRQNLWRWIRGVGGGE